jgi:hypothetical protein
MLGLSWVNGPVGMGAADRVLRLGGRTVLVVVPFVVAGTRLMDVLPLLEADHRVQVVFTVAPAPDGAVCHGVEDLLRSHGALVLPWHQAVHNEFDLVLAASPVGVEQLRGRVMLMPHGSGAVRTLLRARSAGPDAEPTHNLDRATLMYRGRLVPSALVLSHDDELAVLRASCPAALPVAVVAGDICYDRLVASLPFRVQYRRALGVGDTQKLVTVASTWQPESTLGRHPELLDRLLNALPAKDYRVAAILHPNIWNVHGEWQVRAWLADSLRAGLLLMPPEEGWRAALVASDLIIGDHGSVTRYGAAIGVPVALAACPEGEIRRGSVADTLCRCAPRLRPDEPMTGQIRAMASVNDCSWQDAIPNRITSRPGEAGLILRRTIYRLLDLAEPVRALPVSPVPLPRPVTGSGEPR